MKKLFAALVAAAFATATISPVAFADKHMKDEKKEMKKAAEGKKKDGEKKKGEGKKKDGEKKKGEGKKKDDMKK